MLLQLWSLCCECVKAQRSSLNYSQNCHVGVQSATVQASQPPSELVRLDSHTVGLIQLACNQTACSSISLQLARQPAVGPVAQAGVRCAGVSWPELAEHQGRRLQLSAGGGVELGCAGKTCMLQNSHNFGYFEHTGANVSPFFKYHKTWLLKCIH